MIWIAPSEKDALAETLEQRFLATSLSIEPDDFDHAPFSQRGGLGNAPQLFGEQLRSILDELNLKLVA